MRESTPKLLQVGYPLCSISCGADELKRGFTVGSDMGLGGLGMPGMGPSNWSSSTNMYANLSMSNLNAHDNGNAQGGEGGGESVTFGQITSNMVATLGCLVGVPGEGKAPADLLMAGSGADLSVLGVDLRRALTDVFEMLKGTKDAPGLSITDIHNAINFTRGHRVRIGSSNLHTTIASTTGE